MPVGQLLRRVPLFADLTDEELTALSACLGKRAFAKSMILYHKASPAQCLYVVESGQVRIFAVSENGREITIDVYGPGDCFGESALLDGNLRATGAEALQQTVAYTLDRDSFLQYLEKHPRVARRVIELLAHRLDATTVYAENLAFLDVSGRLATVLVDLACRHSSSNGDGGVKLQLTQSELACWVSASREIVNKVLAAYRAEKLIAIAGHSVVVLDLEGLKQKIRC